MTLNQITLDEEDNFSILSYATRLLASETDRERVLVIALDTLCTFAHSNKIAIIMLDKDSDPLTGKIVGMLSDKGVSFPNKTVRADSPPFDQVVETKKPGIYHTARGKPTLCFPLLNVEQKVVGVVAIDKGDYEPLPQNEMQILVILTTLIGVSLEQSLYFRLATYDGLTGLYVRRQFDIRLKEEMARVQRHGGDLSILLADIDHFKQINDTYGHPQGDIILRELASIMRYSVRKDIDIPCRYGGEEFIVILPNTGTKGAFTVADRFRTNCEQYPFSGQDSSVKITISVGIATISQNSEITQEEFLKHADTKLYEAKESGRNKVIAWE